MEPSSKAKISTSKPDVPIVDGRPVEDIIVSVNESNRFGESTESTDAQPGNSDLGPGQVPGSLIIPKLSYPQKFLAGSGHILNDLCASIWFSYLLLYLEKVVRFPGTHSGALMLLGQITDGLATPLIGYEADRANHCWLCRKGYGRCKSWNLIGAIAVATSFPFIFSPCIQCENAAHWARAVYYAPFIVIFQIGWASSQISHLALIPKISPDVLIRTELLAIRYGFTVISNVTVFLLILLTLGIENCDIDENNAATFRNLALYAVGIGSFFTILFHIFVVEKSDEEVKAAGVLMNAEEKNESKKSAASKSSKKKKKRNIVERLTAVTHVRSVTSSMAISKVHAQERRRRISSASNGSGDREAIQSLLGDQDDLENSLSVGVPTAGHSHASPSVQSNFPAINENANGGPESDNRCQMDMKSLNLGKDSMTLRDWLTLPQFYIVAVMYMATRLSVNVTQVYMPLYLQETLQLQCYMVAIVPLIMYGSGFVIALFIKLINKFLGRQLAYIFGATLCVLGGVLILTLDWTPGGVMAEKGIYGIAVLLGGGASAILVTSLAITADLIGNNVENGAFVYGAMSFCDKLSCGLSIMAINTVKASMQPNPQFYQNVLGYTATGCSLAGVLSVFGLTYIIYIQRKRRTNGNE